MIAVLAVAGIMCACGSKGAANEEAAATDSTAVEEAAPAADLSYADQVKAAVELITKAVNEKNGDTLVEGLTAYVASFDAAKSMEELQQVNEQYSIDKLPLNDVDKWVTEEQQKKIAELNLEGAMEKVMTRLMGLDAAAPAAPAEAK